MSGDTGRNHATVADAGYEIRCNNCGALVPSTAETCSACGTVLLGAAVAPPQAELLTPAPSGVSSATTSDLWALAAATAPRYEPGHWGFGGFWIRVLAAFVDYLVTLAVVTAARLSFGLVGLVAVLPLVLTYYPLMEASPWQATLGKRMCGLTVVTLRGERIGVLRAFLRYFAKFLSGLFFCIGFLMVAWTERRRGLHDVIAGTLVVRDLK